MLSLASVEAPERYERVAALKEILNEPRRGPSVTKNLSWMVRPDETGASEMMFSAPVPRRCQE